MHDVAPGCRRVHLTDAVEGVKILEKETWMVYCGGLLALNHTADTREASA